jgi:hypothetical protein
MRRWLKAAFIITAVAALYFPAAFWTGKTQAFWQSRDSNYNLSIATSAGFQGPGDITSGAIAFYSAGRAYNAAYAAAQSPLADIVDTSTGLATCTIKVGTNGYANLSAVVCPTGAPTVSVTTFCTVTHVGCSITKLYDQTGNGNHVVQATLANMPGLTLSAQNGLPCAAGTATAAITLETAGGVSQSAPFTRTAVVERTGNFTTVQKIASNDSNTNTLNFTASANTVSVSNGTAVNLTANDSTFHAILVVASASAPLFAIDSSANTSTSTNGTAALASNEYVMGRNGGTQGLLAGFFCEGGLWPADLNSSYQAMLANMRSATNGWNF